MRQQEEIKKELKDLTPKLYSINKVNPFDIPEEYFDQLAKDIDYRISHIDNEISVVKTTKRINYLPVIVAIAAMFIAVIAGSYLFKADTGVTDIEARLSEVPKDDIETFIYDNIEDFEAIIMMDDEFALLDDPLYLWQDAKITDEYIEEYLLQNINEIIIEEELL